MTDVWDRSTVPSMAVDLVARLEAFSAAAYQDSVGVWTVGYGSTFMPSGRRVGRGDVLGRSDAGALLGHQLQTWCTEICRDVPGPLAVVEAASLVSFVHNLGGGALRGATLTAMLNAGHPDLAQWQFGGWVMAGGKKSLGLMRRRELERRIFAGGTLAEYGAIWQMQQPAFEPSYARAFVDAAAWRKGSPAGTVRPGPATLPVRMPSQPVSDSDALNGAELARVRPT